MSSPAGGCSEKIRVAAELAGPESASKLAFGGVKKRNCPKTLSKEPGYSTFWPWAHEPMGLAIHIH